MATTTTNSAAPIVRALFTETTCGDLIQQEALRSHAAAPKVPICLDTNLSVQDACNALAAHKISSAPVYSPEEGGFVGMFDYRDLVSYVLQVFHKSVDPEMTPSFDAEMEITDIIKRATIDGRTNVPIKLVSNLSSKNPLVAVYTTQPVLTALAHFAETPTLHRVVVLEKTDGVDKFVGVLSQSRVCMLLAERFGRMARKVGDVTAGEVQFPPGEKSLQELGLVKAERVYTVDMNDSVLEALQMMQSNHISSVAIVDKTHGKHTQLQGSISMTDIKEILATRGGWRHLYDACFRFFAQLRNMQGLETGSDRVPLFTVHPSTPLIVAVEKMSATRTHRVWIVSEGSAAGGRSGDVVGVLELSDVMPILLAACE